MLNVLKIQCGSWLACDSGSSANINPRNAAAIAASPGLDSSHKGSAVPPKLSQQHMSNV